MGTQRNSEGSLALRSPLETFPFGHSNFQAFPLSTHPIVYEIYLAGLG